MTNEERNVLRTKMLLLECDTMYISSATNKKWAIIKLGTGYFRFKDDDLRCYYSTEDIAMQAAVKHMLEGRELTRVEAELER